VGQFVAGIEYRIEPVEGVHEGGRLWIKGPNVMLGYLRVTNPGVIEPPKDGWYDTGDIVSVDEDGFVRILGRAKRFAKIGGEMISLAAVEEVLSEEWPEEKHAVVMIKGGPRGETLTLVTSRPGLRREELRQVLSDLGVAEIAIPKKVMNMENIPLLSTGKIDYVSLEEILSDLEPDS
jgi:acyl-[acyl-carrier-protein]-phospholipid O-acyltransferase/long-chain-fatty-acid--[acyl-carrier-protein] ligase